MKVYRIYLGISVFIIILLLASIVGIMIYAGNKIKNESVTFSKKVDSFDQTINNISSNFKNIETELKSENAYLSQQHLTTP